MEDETRAAIYAQTTQIEAGATGLEPATSGVTGRRSNQLNYAPAREALYPCLTVLRWAVLGSNQ
jgi:hypothetical protein